MDILTTISLDDAVDQGSGWIYRSLVGWYKPYYNAHQRIVIKCTTTIPVEILENLVTAVTQLDISRCFIRVVTNQQHVLQWLESNPGFDLEVQKPLVRTSLIHDQTKVSKATLCTHAWSGFHIWPDGTTSVCCDSGKKLVDADNNELNVQKYSLQQIYQSPTLKNIRSSMRQGHRPKECNKCWKLEDLGQPSKRQIAVYALGHVHGMIDWENDDNFYYVGGHLGNYCNLACRICSPDFSSKWVAEIIKTTEQDRSIWKQFQQKRSWVLDPDLFWKQIRELAPRLRAYEFLGGEPLILPENIEFLNWLSENGYSNKSVFRVTTNGTYLPAMLLNPTNYQRLEITFSIDDVGSRFEYQRFGAKWDQIQNNLEKMCSVRDNLKNIKIGINTVISTLNVMYLPDIVDWVAQSGADHWHFSILDYPKELSIMNLPSRVIDQLLPTIKLLSTTYTDLGSLVYKLESSAFNNIDTQSVCEYIESIDQRRGQSYACDHKEMAQLLNLYRMPAQSSQI